MGLGVRKRIAARVGLAAGGLILFASPAFAACTSAATPTVTSSGDSFIMGDEAYIVAPSTTGLFFDDSITGGASSAVITNGVAIDTTGTSNDGIAITGQYDVCYDGLASGSIVADGAGLSIELTDGDVLLNIAHSITAGGAGIAIDHQGGGLIDIKSDAIDAGAEGILVLRSGGTGDTRITANGAIAGGGDGPGVWAILDSSVTGDLDITTNGNITSDDSGIAAKHDGDGDLNITTKAGTTIETHGDTEQPLYALTIDGTVGIYVDRAGVTGGDITIENGANIDVDGVGMYIDVCSCIDSDLLVDSTGTIDVLEGYGIYVSKGATGDTTINQSGKVTVTDGTGVVIDQYEEGDVVASLTGGMDATDGGLIVNHAADGDVTATLGGVSTITDGSGAEIEHSGTGDIDVHFSGDLTADAGAAMAVTHLGDGDISITATGNIQSFAGILAQHFGVGGKAVVNSSADITSEIYGIMTGADDLTVNVSGGTITSEAGIAAFGNDVSVTLGKDATIDVTDILMGVGIAVSGDSEVEIGGQIHAAGGLAIEFLSGDAQLTLLPGFVIEGDVDACNCFTNTLILGGDTGSDSFDLDLIDTQYFGFDELKKSGGSDWTLTGPSFTGDLTADDGIVRVNSDIPGLDLLLTGNGTFKGNGRIGSLTTDGGTVAPGNSIGTVTVAGDVDLGAGTVYEAEVSPTASDLLIAGGTVTIDSGAEVRVVPEPGFYVSPTTYTIIQAGVAVNGVFGSASTTSAFFTATLSYDPDAVLLTLARNALTLGNFAKTPNQKATAAALDGAGAAAPYFGNLFALPGSAVPRAFDALSGDGYASLTAAALDDGRFVRDAALGPARGIWTTPYGGLSHLPGDGNGPGVDHATGGALFGADMAMGDGWLGVLLGYGLSRFDIPSRDMAATSHDASLGVYGGSDWDAFYAHFGGAITGRDIDATRDVAFPGVSDSFAASYASLTAQAFTELGYRIDLGGTTVTPFGALAGLHAITSGYTETGTGAGALTVDPSAASALIATLGLRLEHDITLHDGKTLTLRGSAAWRHAIGKATVTNSMAGTGNFTVAGAPLAADTIDLSAGATLSTGTLDISFDYTGTLGSGGVSNAATATLAGQF